MRSARKGFGQHKLRNILCPRWHGMGMSTQVEMHFVSSLTLDEAGQPVGICILVLAGVGGDCSTRI